MAIQQKPLTLSAPLSHEPSSLPNICEVHYSDTVVIQQKALTLSSPLSQEPSSS
jgi:hypothetical protein